MVLPLSDFDALFALAFVGGPGNLSRVSGWRARKPVQGQAGKPVQGQWVEGQETCPGSVGGGAGNLSRVSGWGAGKPVQGKWVGRWGDGTMSP